MRETLWIIPALLLFAAIGPPSAHADTIDFSSLPSGTVVTNQYPGVVFSLQSPGGSPITDNLAPLGGSFTGGGEGLENTTCVQRRCLQSDILDIAFTSPVSGVSFTFDSYGNNGVTVYIASNGSTANIGSDLPGFRLISVPGSGITDLQINNGSTNWIFAIAQLTFNPTPVPEPGTSSLMLIGVGLVLVMRQRIARGLSQIT